MFEATKSRSILNQEQAGRVQGDGAPLLTKFCRNAQTSSQYKQEIKVFLNSPERVFVAWHTPKRRQWPSQSPWHRISASQVYITLPFSEQSSLQNRKNIWALKVGSSGRIKLVTQRLSTLLYIKNPPNNPIFWDLQLSVSSQFSRSNSRSGTELNLIGAKTLLPNSFYPEFCIAQS